MALDTSELDGRRARRALNREAVLNALEELWREGNFDASSNDVAERAGLSSRSLFRYFDDIDDLIRSAIDRSLERFAPLAVVPTTPDRPTDEKVTALCDALDRLFSAAGMAAHAARATSHRNPLVAARIEATRNALRENLARLFGPELATTAPGTLDIVSALTSYEAWELLHRGSKREQAVAREGLEHALNTLLTKEKS